MTREEIIKESRKYVKLKVREREELCGVYPAIQAAFLAGAEFVCGHPINVWHNVYEEPNKDSYIIMEIADENNGPLYNTVDTYGVDDEFWKYLTSKEPITRWAYINDLLPKVNNNGKRRDKNYL